VEVSRPWWHVGPRRPARPGTYRSALGHTDFRRLIAAYGVTAVGQTFGSVAMAVAMYDLTRSATWVAAIAAARLLPYLVVPGLAGVIAARVPRRGLLVASSAARAVLALVLASAVASGAPPLILVLLALMFTACGTPGYPAMAAAVPDTLSLEDLAPGNGLLTSVETLAFVLGPALGGAVLVRASPAAALAVNTFVFALGVGLATRVAPAPPAASAHESVTAALRAGARLLRHAPAVAAPVVLLLVVNLTDGTALVALVIYAREVLHGGDAAFGVLTVGLGVGALLGVTATNRLASAQRQLAVLGAVTLLAGVPYALLGGLSSLPVAAGLMVVAGGAGVATEVLAITLVQRVLSRERVALVFGLLDSLIFMALFVGSALAPLLIRLVGVRAALAIFGAVIPVAALVCAARLGRNAQPLDQEIVARVALLRGLPWLRDGLVPTLQGLASDAREESVQPGTHLIDQGADPDDFFVVVSGSLEVRKRSGGTEEVVALLGPGTGFGEIGLLQGVPRTASVVALEPSVVLRVRGDRFVATVSAVAPAAGSTAAGGLLARMGGGAENP
jgi:MFS family permease